MQTFWEAWSSLDAQAQAIVLGLAAAVLFGAVKRIWPNLAVSEGAIKQYLVALIAGLGAYAATGNVLTAVLAFLSAIGSYELYKHQVARRVERARNGG